jgi:hypothetical protein
MYTKTWFKRRDPFVILLVLFAVTVANIFLGPPLTPERFLRSCGMAMIAYVFFITVRRFTGSLP